jgi:hypothetical protein
MKYRHAVSRTLPHVPNNTNIYQSSSFSLSLKKKKKKANLDTSIQFSQTPFITHQTSHTPASPVYDGDLPSRTAPSGVPSKTTDGATSENACITVGIFKARSYHDTDPTSAREIIAPFRNTKASTCYRTGPKACLRNEGMCGGWELRGYVGGI